MVQRVSEFDIWRPGYGGAVVGIYVAGTSTLANVYTDEALTQAADNPQTLESMEAEGGVRYGKFAAPLYTAQSYYTSINGIENTGIVRPAFSSLSGEDASAATVQAAGASYGVTLAALAGREVNAANFGAFVEGSGGVAATNTTTLELAIAALSDGGVVKIPAGLYKVNAFDVPEDVIIQGQGAEATTLECINGSDAFTIVGDGGGFRDITLDGNTLTSGSVGVKSVGNDAVVFDAVLIKRFETGAHFLGGKSHVWHDLSIENTATAIKLHGDTDAGDSTNGDAFEDLIWVGGVVSVATTLGVSMSYEDAVCHNLTFMGVGFESCTDYATDINGAQNIQFIGCWWVNNTKTVNIQDDTDVLTPTTEQNNDVINITFQGGRMDGGEFEATGTVQNVVLRDMKLDDIEFILSTPLDNYIVLQDCFEFSGVTISGEAAKLIRSTTSQDGSSFGVTTTATATKAWSIPLQPGQQVYLEAKVIGKGRNDVERAIYHIGCGAYRPGSELDYDTQTANFTAGAILTGASSGATARIQDDTDGGTTGTLILTDISGEFIDNEIITDDNGTPGSATVNGTLTAQNVTLDSTGNVNLRAVFESTAGFLAAFVANNDEIELRVTGAASKTMEWTVNVDVVST